MRTLFATIILVCSTSVMASEPEASYRLALTGTHHYIQTTGWSDMVGYNDDLITAIGDAQERLDGFTSMPAATKTQIQNDLDNADDKRFSGKFETDLAEGYIGDPNRGFANYTLANNRYIVADYDGCILACDDADYWYNKASERLGKAADYFNESSTSVQSAESAMDMYEMMGGT